MLEDSEQSLNSNAFTTSSTNDIEPDEDSLLEYARSIGINPENEPNLMFIAKEGYHAPLNAEWEMISTEDGDAYFYNNATKESAWEHPLDSHFRKRVFEEREKLRQHVPESNVGTTTAEDDEDLVTQFSPDSELDEMSSIDSVMESQAEHWISGESSESSVDENWIYKQIKEIAGDEINRTIEEMEERLNAQMNNLKQELATIQNLLKNFHVETPNVQDVKDAETDSLSSQRNDPQTIEKLSDIEQEVEKIIERNWREYCLKVTYSYAHVHEISGILT
uniref:WW domain-containing protein n=1 Tax=Acrobeloides nanus TaxID=290746 RepID=A0A914DPL1_9BILA